MVSEILWKREKYVKAWLRIVLFCFFKKAELIFLWRYYYNWISVFALSKTQEHSICAAYWTSALWLYVHLKYIQISLGSLGFKTPADTDELRGASDMFFILQKYFHTTRVVMFRSIEVVYAQWLNVVYLPVRIKNIPHRCLQILPVQ